MPADFVWIFILIFNSPTVGFACMVELPTSDEKGSYVGTFTDVDCNTLFETCCRDGCCLRFSHAHIWIFAATFSFIIILAVFGCWLICCKRRSERHRHWVTEPQPGNPGDSPMVTLVIPGARSDAGIQNINPVPVTPPPSYEEATRR